MLHNLYMNRQTLATENHILKMRYNDLLHRFMTLQKEMKDCKDWKDKKDKKEHMQHTEPMQNTESYDSYKKTLHFLQNRNAELNRLLITKPVVKPPIIRPRPINPTLAPHVPPTGRSISPFHIYYDSPELLEAYLLTHDSDSDC